MTLDNVAHRSLILYTDSLTPYMQLISTFISLSGPGRTTIQLDGTQANHCKPCPTQSQSVCWIQNGSFGIYLVIFDVQSGIVRSDRSCEQMILLKPSGSGFVSWDMYTDWLENWLSLHKVPYTTLEVIGEYVNYLTDVKSWFRLPFKRPYEPSEK